MTELTEASAQSNQYFSMWYLVAPATGANNIVASFSSQLYSWCTSASYTGVSQIGFPDASDSTSDASGDTITGTVTTTVDNCWTVMSACSANASDLAAGTGTTIRELSLIGNFEWLALCDSNGAITPAGSTSLICETSVTHNIGNIIASLAPAEGGATANSIMFGMNF